jgi:MFS family permease
LPSTMMMLIIGAQAGRLQQRFGSKPPLIAGAVLTMACYLLLATERTDRWEIYLASTLLGAGIGLAFAAMMNLIIENVGPAQTGVATGVNALTRTVGGSFGGAVVASILAGTVGAAGFPSSHAYTLAFAVCAAALLLGVLFGLLIPQRRPEAAFLAHEAGDLSAAG